MATFGIKSVISVIDRATAPLERVNKAIKNSFSPIRKLHNATVQLSKGLGIPKVGRAFTSLKGKIGDTVGQVRTLGRELAIVGGLAAGFMGATMYSAANAADAAGKTAEKLSITADSWTRLSYAGDMAGVSSDKVRQGLTRLTDMSTKAARGGKEASYWFRKFGVSVRDQNGALKSADALLMEASEKFAGMENGANKTRLAIGLFGQNLGADIVPLLNAGKAGIDAFGAEAGRMGLVFSPDQVRMSSEFNDSISRLKNSIKGASYAIGFELIPLFQPWIDDLRELVIANKDFVATKAREYIGWIRDEAQALIPKLEKLWKKIDGLVQGFGGWSTVLPYIIGALALFKLAPLILSVGLLTKAVIGFGIALLTTPIGWIALGIAALVAGFIYLWRNCEGFRDFWLAMWDKVTGYFDRAVERIKTAFDKGIIEGIYAILAEFNPVALIASAIDGITEYFFGMSLTDAGIHLVTSLWDGLKSAWGSVAGWLSKKVDELTGWMPDWVREKLGFKVDVASATAPLDSAVGNSTLDAITTVQSVASDSPLANQLEQYQLPDPIMEGMNLDAALARGEMPTLSPGQQSPALQMVAQRAEHERQAAAGQDGEVKIVFENLPPNAKVQPRNTDVEIHNDPMAGAYAGMRML